MIWRVFRSEHYERKLQKLNSYDQERVIKFEQSLKIEAFNGKPIGYKFFREKRFDGKRLIFLVYEEHNCVFLVTITDKKAQQKEIDFIKTHLDVYHDEVKKIMDDI